ncbi:MAG: hypothetical protein KME17_21490 [Cyanosarcina radialis HA8281-LM2]|nr:hypothetical protein [Cyanosarcina radialis HA8281-LM2]
MIQIRAIDSRRSHFSLGTTNGDRYPSKLLNSRGDRPLAVFHQTLDLLKIKSVPAVVQSLLCMTIPADSLPKTSLPTLPVGCWENLLP